MSYRSAGSLNKTVSGRESSSGLLGTPLPLVNDPESQSVPASLPLIVDAHVHLFPDNFFAAIWNWFEQFGWPIRYRLTSPQIIEFLLSRGINHIVALHYAHKPGVAQELNAYMAKLSQSHSGITALATVFPGEDNAAAILKDAFQNGLKGVKLHSHVQCFDINSAYMDDIYETCVVHHKPLIVHAGREPKSPAYRCDPHVLCSAEKLERVLKDFPSLNICVPHLGADEFGNYRQLLEKYDNLWLDTTMTLAEYLPLDFFPDLMKMRVDRLIFGTDFPNLPYAWDRELKRLVELNLPDDALTKILGRNAIEFYCIQGNTAK